MPEPTDTEKMRRLSRAMTGEFTKAPSLQWDLAFRAEKALMQMANEIDALRDDQEGLVDQHSLIHSRGEAARLRSIIERAPHDADSCERVTYNGYDPSRSCTCWKAQA